MSDHQPTSKSKEPSTPPQNAGQTPRAVKVSATELFATLEQPLSTIHQRLLEETKGHYLGPMPIDLFFSKFMPMKKRSLKRLEPAQVRIEDLKSLQTNDGRSSYEKLVSALTEWPTKRPPRIVDSHSYRDKDCKGLGVDITVYANGKPQISRRISSIMDFANAESWIEIKPARNYDAFVDPTPKDKSRQDEEGADDDETGEHEDVDVDEDEDGDEEAEEDEDEDGDKDEDVGGEGPIDEFDVVEGSISEKKEDSLAENLKAQDPKGSPNFPFENSTERGRSTRAQLASYAGATMATQFRSHLFTTLIVGELVRFIRWDRSGAIVTKAFNYVQQPHLMFEFFKRFAQLSRSERGNYPNISPATKTAATMARQKLDALGPQLWLGQAGKFLRSGSVDIETQPFLQLEFQGRTFIVPSPHCSETGLSPFGRASRGRTVVDLRSREVLYLKDSWQNPNRPSEVHIYKRLKEHGVKNVANLKYGGNLGSPTSTQCYVNHGWVFRNGAKPIGLRALCSDIVVLDVVGLGLVAFRTAYQLVSCLADGMEAYEEALSKAKVMHRDISANNILIVRAKDETQPKRQKGILIDWDHAIILDDPMLPQSLRTGTWSFMSLALKLFPGFSHTPQDDRESAFHVLTWISLRHLEHKISDVELIEYMGNYDAMILRLEDAIPVGNRAALYLLKAKYQEFDFDLEPIDTLIKDLATAFSQRYDNLKFFEIVKPTKDQLPKGDFNDSAWLVRRLRMALETLNPHLEDENACDWTNHFRRMQEKKRTSDVSSLVLLDKLSETKYFNGLIRSRFLTHPELNPSNEIKAVDPQASGGGAGTENNSGVLEKPRLRKRRKIGK